MSIKIMSRVWEESSCEGSQLLLLLALADHASDDGVCWPGIARLAHKTRKSERYTKTLIQKIEESGELHVARNAGRSNTNMYYITLGFERPEIIHTLVKRFSTDPNRAEYIAQTILHRQGKGALQLTFSEKTEGDPQDEKGDPQCQKVNPSVEIGAPQITQTIMNHQNNHQETHGASAPSAPAPPDPDTAAWIADLEAAEAPPRNPPHSADEFRQRVHETEERMLARIAGDPWSTWGVNSVHAQDYFQQLDGQANPVRQLGYEIETELHLVPNWNRKTDVKGWIRGLVACLEATDGNVETVIQAGRKLRRDEMTISDPWSLVKTARGLYAAWQGGQDVSKPTANRIHQRDNRGRRSQREQWTQDEIDERIRVTAEELGEPCP